MEGRSWSPGNRRSLWSAFGVLMRKPLAIVALLGLFLIGCSDTPVQPSPYTETRNGTVAAFGTNRETMSTPRAGTLTVELTWPDSSVDLDLYLAPTTCMNLYPQSGCGVLASSTKAGTTSETLTRNVLAGESFAIFIDNVSASKDQGYSVNFSIR